MKYEKVPCVECGEKKKPWKLVHGDQCKKCQKKEWKEFLEEDYGRDSDGVKYKKYSFKKYVFTFGGLPRKKSDFVTSE